MDKEKLQDIKEEEQNGCGCGSNHEGCGCEGEHEHEGCECESDHESCGCESEHEHKHESCGCGEEHEGCGCEGEHEHEGCGCGCEDEALIVDLEDENGNIVPCEMVDKFSYKDNEYVLVQNPEDDSVYLFKVVGTEEESELVVPEDKEFEEVSSYYEGRLDKEEK